MSPVEVSKSTGIVLDWLVAKALGDCQSISIPDYSNVPDLALPILEREGINLRAIRRDGHPKNGQWLAAYNPGNSGTIVQWVKRLDYPNHYTEGPTMLVAGLRCFVVKRLGEEVDVPIKLISKEL